MGNWPDEVRKRRDLVRFWKNTRLADQCIVWTGQLSQYGYGKFTTTVYPKIQTHHLAHRWIYQTILGNLSTEEIVMHTCDNRACVTLQHLDRGNTKLNAQDMMHKGRGNGQFSSGESHPNAKLTLDQVQEIKRLRLEGLTHAKIASIFSLTRETVRDICNGKRWRNS